MSITQHSLYENINTNLRRFQIKRLHTKSPKAAVLLPLLTHSNDMCIVFTRRSSHLNIHPGEVAFPGGKFDKKDKDLQATALRESYEEIGLQPTDVQIIGMCSDILSSTGIQVTPVVGILTEHVILKPNYDELDEIFYVPLSFFTPAQCHSITLNKNECLYRVPEFNYKGHHIWGLTALILVEFLTVTCGISFEEFGFIG